jgi:hypothetical protein
MQKTQILLAAKYLLRLLWGWSLHKMIKIYKSIMSILNFVDIRISAKFPYEKSNRTTVQQNATMRLISEVRAKVDTSDYMPCTTIFLFEALFNVFGGILEVLQLTTDQLRCSVFRDQQSVLFHVWFHITIANIKG